METLPLMTALIALITSLLMGMLRGIFDKINELSKLVKQLVVFAIAVGLVVFFHFFDFGLIPEVYKTPLFGLIQALVAGLSAIGMNNVKDGVVEKAKQP